MCTSPNIQKILAYDAQRGREVQRDWFDAMTLEQIAPALPPAGVAASCSGHGFRCSSSGGDFDRGFDRSPELPWPPRPPLTAATACGRDRGDCFRGCLGRSSFGGDFERDFDRDPELPRPRRPPLTTALVSGLTCDR